MEEDNNNNKTMVFRYSYIIPILVLFWFPITFLITYLVSLFGNKIQPLFPFISDTGTWSPESCIFGLMLNTGAVLIGIIMYIRFRQIRELLENEDDFEPSIKIMNIFSLFLGMLAVFGIILVGHFQETNQIIVHMLGAMLAFGLGTLYQSIQTFISIRVYPKLGNRYINILRSIFCTICTITCSTTTAFGILGFLHYKGNIEDIPKWSKDDGGFEFRTVSAVSEWILVITTVFYMSTFVSEFRQVTFSEPPIKLNDA